MKYFSATNPIVDFQIACPMDAATHHALARAVCVPNKEPFLASVECHGSFECTTCRDCLRYFAEMFRSDREPDLFNAPLAPLL